MNLSHLWDDWPTRLALCGLAFVILYMLVMGRYMLVMGRYMALHYTRIPGGKWTTWEKAMVASEPVEERRAA